MLILFVIQLFLEKPTMEEFIPSKAEKKTLGCSCFEYFWSFHKHFLGFAFAIQKSSEKLPFSYAYKYTSLPAYLLPTYSFHSLYLICYIMAG